MFKEQDRIPLHSLDVMSAESTDSKGEDRVENVLDDILDGHNVDDDLATEIKEDAKPSTAIARPSRISSKV